MINKEDILAVAESMIERVVKDQIEVNIDVGPDRITISMNPWKPYEMGCPYGR